MSDIKKPSLVLFLKKIHVMYLAIDISIVLLLLYLCMYIFIYIT